LLARTIIRPMAMSIQTTLPLELGRRVSRHLTETR
jgi:hypothetical protein